MSQKTKRLALMGKLPLHEKFLKISVRLKPEKRLLRDGWVLSGEGFSDSSMTIGVYKSFYRDQFVYVPKEAAVPHYPVFSGNPDFWMYGEMVKRHYLHYYLDMDRTEDRGVSFHKTDHTKTFKHEKLKWDYGDGYDFSSYGFD